MAPILRTKCNVAYTTPSSSTLSLPVNCAVSDSDGWPWKYFWTKTLGTDSPQLSNGYLTGLPFIVEGGHESGQTVIRAIFAYIATDPISVEINLNLEATIQPGTSITEENNGFNEKLIVKLYEPDGSVIENYIDSPGDSYSSIITLPATVCPKVLWIGASVQPYGFDPVPTTSASIEFSAV